MPADTRVLLLPRYGPLGASSRLRMLQYVPLLEARGFSFSIQPLLDDAALAALYGTGRYGAGRLLRAYALRLRALLRAGRYDLAWIEKEALPWWPAWLERLLLRQVPCALDFDDAVFHTYDRHRSALVRRLLGRRVDAGMRAARVVVAGNGYLAARARDAGAPRVAQVPTVVDLRHYPAATPPGDAPVPAGPPRIAWIGSPSTVHYLRRVAAPLRALARERAFRLRVIGGGRVDLPGVDVESVAWSRDAEAQRLRECAIGIMPLPDAPWERGKCGYKLVQYMACGLPVVASPVGANVDIVAGREGGLLAGDDAGWTDALRTLLDDPALRHRLGARGRAEVEREYSVQAQVDRVATLLREAAA